MDEEVAKDGKGLGGCIPAVGGYGPRGPEDPERDEGERWKDGRRRLCNGQGRETTRALRAEELGGRDLAMAGLEADL